MVTPILEGLDLCHPHQHTYPGATLTPRSGQRSRERLVWASEAPVLHWRDESIETAMAWVDRFSPSAAQREAFFGATAQSRIFERPVAPVAPLDLPFDPFDYLVSKSTPMWDFGLNLDSELPARLVAGWVAWGGSARGPLRHYLEDVLRTSLPAMGS